MAKEFNATALYVGEHGLNVAIEIDFARDYSKLVARLRHNVTGNVTRWQKIKTDKEGKCYVMFQGLRLYATDFQR